MRRLVFFALTAGAVVACNNLHLSEGNAYPCDFSQPPEKRDTPCLGTDVCSINNLCVAYVNEGPRFEGGITVARLPAYAREGFALNASTPLHPGVLNQPITFLATDALRPSGSMLVGTADGLFTVKGTVLGPRDAGEFPLPDAGALTQALLVSVDDTGPLPAGFTALAGLSGGALTCGARDSTSGTRTCGPGVVAERLRASLVPPAVRVTPPPAGVAMPLQGIANGEAFQVELSQPTGAFSLQSREAFTLEPFAVAEDVAVLNNEPLAATPVVLARDGLYLRQQDAGFERQVQAAFGDGGTLSLNFASTVLTANNRTRLSTWTVAVTSPPQRMHTLSQAWPDCEPCRNGFNIAAVTPLPPSQGVGVEVLCRAVAGSGFSLVRVTGSNAPTPQDACTTQTLSPPLDPSVLSSGGLLVANAQRGITFGNDRGNVWSGETLSTVLPLALERVPLDVTTIVSASGTPTLVAVTDRYLAAFDPAPPSTGFRRVAAAEFNVGEDLRFVSAVRGTGADGWGVLANGVVAHANLGVGADALRFGPRLVTPSGEAMSRSVGGEAYVLSDGGVPALFVTADDGLYAVFNPDATLGDSPGGSLDVTPQLQPEPSVPIRSLALERTPLGTNGSTRARGYLVTSRNVYEWSLAGTPARWSSTQLALGGGEPVEVWFDTERSALGRVGYADGQIFTLPSGFQLTMPLVGDGSAPEKVLDYENFGGWPVALTTTGLFAASWDVVDGKVQNRFDDGRSNRPMDWHRLKLADGSEPWKGQRGKLFVRLRMGVGTDCGEDNDSARRIYSLTLFLPGEVRKLAEYCRN